MRNMLLGSVTGGVIALVTAKIVELFLYNYYRGPLLVTILIGLVSLLVVGLVLHRSRVTPIPIKTILTIALIIIALHILLFFLIDIIEHAWHEDLSTFNFLGSLGEQLLSNLYWLIGGIFVGVSTAVAFPFLENYNLQNNLPLLIVLALILIFIAIFGRYTFIDNSGIGFGNSSLAIFGIIFWGVLMGGFVARQLQKRNLQTGTV